MKIEDVVYPELPKFIKRTCFTFNSKRPEQHCKIGLSDLTDDHKFICPVTGCISNNSFTFHFMDREEVEEFLGEKLPKFAQGWQSDKYSKRYSGNSMLNATDAVAELETPLNRPRCRMPSYESFSFDFQIGLSKSMKN